VHLRGARGGDLYFKAMLPACGFEAALSATLYDLAPRAIPQVLAWDAGRGWLLLADGGASFRGVQPEGDGLARWQEMLRQLADLQRVAAATERLVAAGCPDRRLSRLPALYAELVDDEDSLLLGRPGGVTPEEHGRLRALQPEVERMCDELASSGPAETLHHDDLGPGNVLVAPDGRFVFFDWGDVAVTHPFCSAFIPLRWARLVYHLSTAALDQLRDAYLSRWPEYGPPQRQRAAFAIAHRLGALHRALTWRAFMPHLNQSARWEYADAPAYFARHFLDGSD
jgi:hypothetical protein